MTESHTFLRGATLSESLLRWRMICGALALLACVADTHSQESTEETVAEDAPDSGPSVSGSLTTRLNLSLSNRDSDVFLDEILNLRVKFPKHEKVSLHTGLWLIEDLDGSEDRASTLRGLKDASGTAVQARLLHLYLELDDVWKNSTLRIGRQRILASPQQNRIDGLFFSHRGRKIEWYAFAGGRASLYRDTHEDFVTGGGLAGLLSHTTRVSLDFFYAEQNRRDSETVRRTVFDGLLGRAFPRTVKEEFDSRVVTLSLHQRVGERHQLFGRYTFYDGDSDEFLISATGYTKGREVVYDVSYRKRLEVLGDRADDVTGFYRILGRQEKFDDVQASVRVPLNERFSIGLEGQLHDSRRDSPNSGNRDFYRLGATLSALEIAKGLDGHVGVARWVVDDGEGSWAITGELTKSWARAALTVGVDYERYKDRINAYRPNVFLADRLFSSVFRGFTTGPSPLVALLDTGYVTLHENIYSLYTKVDCDIAAHQRASLKISVEEDDGRDSPYWVIDAKYTLSF